LDGINLLLTVGGLALASAIAFTAIRMIARSRRRARSGSELGRPVPGRDAASPRAGNERAIVGPDLAAESARPSAGAETSGHRLEQIAEAAPTLAEDDAKSSGRASAVESLPGSQAAGQREPTGETELSKRVVNGALTDDVGTSGEARTESAPGLPSPAISQGAREHAPAAPPLSVDQGAPPPGPIITPELQTAPKEWEHGSNGQGAASESAAPGHLPMRPAAVPGEVAPAQEDVPKASATKESLRRPKAPRRYRPPTRAPSAPQEDRATARAPQEPGSVERAFRIEVRLVFEKAGFARVSLLPERDPSLPEEMIASGSGNPPEMIALQDEWFQDVTLPDLGTLLRQGIEWQATSEAWAAVRWSLGGRDVYVLCPHSDLNGFVSGPRLVIGEEHVVLCTTERLDEVTRAIALTGSPAPEQVDERAGMPPGWIGLRGVVPRTPVPPRGGGDILDVLRPLAEIEIVLQGGIRLERSTWLKGYPPRIRLRGVPGPADQVLIDGQVAVEDPLGAYSAPGWDQPGQHQVWCTSASRTYSIREGAEDWDGWDAYRWSMEGSDSDQDGTRPVVCGVLVRPPRLSAEGGQAILCASSNPVLLGAIPGEVEVCRPRDDLRAGTCIGFPWFTPVWAAPFDPLRCDKRTARVVLVGSPRPVKPRDRIHVGRPELRRIAAWCSAILAVGRKGLDVNPPGPETTALWQAYKRTAKAIWRRLR